MSRPLASRWSSAHVTLVRDATAAFTREMMHAAHELNGPTFAHAIVTTAELVKSFAAR
jgi:nicotinamidase-related amidase